ncbi:MAG: ferredoxin-NADP reductase [Alphaproteobacteria bacterium]|nr:ferredoxin-NADP reductase [Alphaproteobacteria bacterium]
MTTPSIAVVGTGPAGFYVAEALLKGAPEARIDLIDRLPTPFGLARAGVAPDHQGNKGVIRLFARFLDKPSVRLIGGIEVGRDVPLEELRATYDAVILAIGAAEDRRLGISGEGLRGVHGSLAFVGWYNGHPDHADLDPPLAEARSAVVIGNGNVAIDVARVLAKSAAEMAKSDLSPRAAAAIHAAPLAEIALIGRRGPAEARFTNPELAELGRLERAIALVEDEVPEATTGDKTRDANLVTLKTWQANRREAKPIGLALRFGLNPVEFLAGGNGRLRAVVLTCADGARREIQADLAITAIGYRTRPLPGVTVDAASGALANREGRVGGGLYVVGWAKRGPSGTIATNRADSIAVAQTVLADLGAALGGKPGPDGLDLLLLTKGKAPVTTTDWKRIDAAEIAAAAPGAPRRKLVTWAELRAAMG